MTRKSLWSVFGLALLLLCEPSLAGTYEDGYAAYGRGDYAAAFQIWKGLADQGSQSAQYGLGQFYARGQGVSQDDREAAVSAETFLLLAVPDHLSVFIDYRADFSIQEAKFRRDFNRRH